MSEFWANSASGRESRKIPGENVGRFAAENPEKITKKITALRAENPEKITSKILVKWPSSRGHMGGHSTGSVRLDRRTDSTGFDRRRAGAGVVRREGATLGATGRGRDRRRLLRQFPP